AHMSLNDLTDYLRAKGKNRFEDPEKIAKMIQKAAQSSYRLDKDVEDSIDTILATSITVIRTFEKQIKELDKSIKRIMAGMTQTLESVPGIGPVFAAGIIAEIGQIERFEDETKIDKYAGLYWRKHQSGVFTSHDTSLTQNGKQYLTYYLVESNISVRRQVPESKVYYEKTYREVPNHQCKRARALTATKLVR